MRLGEVARLEEIAHLEEVACLEEVARLGEVARLEEVRPYYRKDEHQDGRHPKYQTNLKYRSAKQI